MRRHILVRGAAAMAVAAFLACNDDSVPSAPSDGPNAPRTSRVSPLGPAVERPASDDLHPSFIFVVAPGDTTTDPCFGGEFCGVQGRPAGGLAEVYCPNGPGTCPSQQYRWSLQNPPPNTTTTFDPEVTVTDQTTTFLIHTDSTTVPGTYQPVLVSTRVSTNTVNSADTLPVRIRCNQNFKSCPQLEIVDLAKGPDSVVSAPKPKQTTLIGKRLNLLVRWKVGSGTGTYHLDSMPAPPASPRSPRWNISGSVIKSYDLQYGTLDSLPASALLRDTVAYYWYVANTAASVYVVATLVRDDGRQLSFPEATASYAVQGPTNLQLLDPTTTVQVGLFNSVPGDTALSFGTALQRPNSSGIHFTFRATKAPSDTGGYIAATQLIKVQTQYVRNPAGNPNALTVPPTNGAFWLDACQLYRGTPVGQNVVQESSGQYTYTADDAPASFLTPDFNSVTRLDNFKTVFMFRPSGPTSIWVPVYAVPWTWGGTATRDTLTNVWLGPTNPIQSVNPLGSASSTFPQWPATFQPGLQCAALPSS